MKMSLLACFFATSSKKSSLEFISLSSTARRTWLSPFNRITGTQLSLIHNTSPIWLTSPSPLAFAPVSSTRSKVDNLIKSSIAISERLDARQRPPPRRVAAEEGEENLPQRRYRGPRKKKDTKVVVVDSNVKKLRKLRDGGVFRADRVLANRGWGSRSECFQLLLKKQVSILDTTTTANNATSSKKSKSKGDNKDTKHKSQDKVELQLVDPNVRILQGPMERIAMHSKLFVRGQPVPEIPLLMVYHKPKWMLSTMSDPQHSEKSATKSDSASAKQVNKEEDLNASFEDVEGKNEGETTTTLTTTTPATTVSTSTTTDSGPTTSGGRPNLGQVLPPIYQRQELHPVGRLDYDSSGLILFSSLGTLTQKLLHPSHKIEKEYRATVSGNPSFHALERQLAEGVSTADGVYTAQLLDVKPVPQSEVPHRLQHIIDNLPLEYDVQELDERGYLREVKTATQLSHIRLVVTEGKHRMVRRMLANLGYPVMELQRLRHGMITLGDLPAGHFRFLSKQELEWAETLLYKQWMRPAGKLTTTTTVRRKRKQLDATSTSSKGATTTRASAQRASTGKLSVAPPKKSKGNKTLKGKR